MIFEHSRILLNKTFNLLVKDELRILGWLLVVVCSLIILYLTKNTSLSLNYSIFCVIFVASLNMWIFRLVPEYVPSALIILTAICFHIAPQKTVLSGFSSDGFFIALSVFSVGALLTKSRLIYRLCLILLIRIPVKQSLLQKALFFVGALMTTVMSVQSSRVAIMAPLLDDILESSKINPQSDSANALANSAFNGCILLSTIFLTGKSSNFVIYGLLSEQNQWKGNWFDWLWFASFPGLLLIVVFFIMQSLTFKPQKPLTLNHFKLKKELFALGALSLEECSAILTFFVFSFGAILSTWKGISSVWTCLTIFLILLCTRSLNKKEIQSRINWSFLFYFGSIIGVTRAIQNMGVGLWLTDHLQWLSFLAQNELFLFIILVYFISWLGGLLLGTMIAPAVLFTALIPFAQLSTISNWVIAFVILVATEAWVFPYQSSYFLCFEELLKRNNNFLLSPLLKLNAWFSILKLCVILFSLPFWYFLGVLT